MPVDLRDPGPTWAQHISNELQRRSHFIPGTRTETEIARSLFVTTIPQHAPSGSGFDNGTELSETSTPDHLVFLTAFHHMNAHGVYVGWTHHTVVVTPAFTGFHIRVTGSNKPRGHSRSSPGIKDYILEQFHNWLSGQAKV